MSSSDCPDYRRASWWDRLVRIVELRERRRRNRRRRKPRCQNCGAASLRVVGNPFFGARIVTCARCGGMDRRLPSDRREPGWTPRMDQVGGIAWGRLVAGLLAAVTAFLLALSRALEAHRW